MTDSVIDSSPADPAEDGLREIKMTMLHARGLDFDQYRDSYLRRRVGIRLRANGLSSMHDYACLLRRSPEECDKLLSCLTVNVTRFFRNAPMFRVLEREVVPEIVSRKREQQRRTIRVWSAACSSGEETYSLGILLCHALDGELDDWHCVVNGTDIDDECLQRAEEGVYPSTALSEMPNILKLRFFTLGDEVAVPATVRRIVRFSKADLMAPPKFRAQDLVMCRNVLIYFDKETQMEVLERLAAALSPGGYLVIGKTESMVGPAAKQLEVVDLRQRIYRKPLAKRWRKSAS